VPFTFRNHSGIHEGGERKVGDDEECEDSLDGWNIWMLWPVVSTSIEGGTEHMLIEIEKNLPLVI
jgi:hypothetical protein